MALRPPPRACWARLPGPRVRPCLRTSRALAEAVCNGHGLLRHQRSSHAAAAAPDAPGACPTPTSITVDGQSFATDAWTNTPAAILAATSSRLHLREDHPIALTRALIESRFPAFARHNTFAPAVSTLQNFDSLGFPADHPGRARSDTYYLNAGTVLRTHTSAHQADVFRADRSDAWLISADVYRRDAVDRSHYPVFHQMEGARTWDRAAHGGSVAAAARAAAAALPRHDLIVEDPNPTVHPLRNPLQRDAGHTLDEVEAVAAHLKRSIEDVVVAIFAAARQAAGTAAAAAAAEPLRVRWVEAYFPFTSPSWELEVLWQGEWLEVLGCGVVLQRLLDGAGVGSRLGWAFGIGLERIAMLLFEIPDIRLFWSADARFTGQFRAGAPLRRFVPYSRHPPCYKDVSFWVPPAADVGVALHENDVMELVRTEAGDLAEDVRLTDDFTHPGTGRRSLCYRINYRSLERTLFNDEINELHGKICAGLVGRFGVEIR